MSIKYLTLIGYELATVLLPFFVVFAVLAQKEKQQNRATSPLHFLLLFTFAVYIAAAFYFTGAGTLFDLLRYGQEIHNGQYNFVPFSHHIDVVAYVQNILLFVPLGGLLPLIWPKTDTLKSALLSGFSFSLLIEISQLFNHRATDVDDLIMNTAGALLGYLLYKLFVRVAKWSHKRAEHPNAEPVLYIGAMFVGHFLLYNEMGLAKILYGF